MAYDHDKHPPIVEGGQGRSASDITDTLSGWGTAMMAFAILAALALALAEVVL